MPESKPISNFDSARDSAVQGTTDAAVRAVNGVSSAALRSKERSANIVQSGAAFGRTTAAAGGALVATFVDIERMATTLGEHTRTTINEAGRVLPVAGRGDLLESFILSPATGYLAETAVLAAASRLGVHIAMATGLGIVAVTIVSTYQLADTALELGAAGFSFGSTAVVNTVASGIDLGVSAVRATGDFIVAEVSGNVKVLIAGVTTVVAGATIAATLALVLRGALESAIAGFGAEASYAFIQTAHETLSTDPWLVLSPLALSAIIARDVGDNFSTDRALGGTIDSFQRFLGALGPGFDSAITGLIWSAGVMGWKDGGALNFAKNPDGSLKLDKTGNPIPLSIVSDKQDRLDTFAAAAAEAGVRDVDGSNIVPDSLDTLLLSMGQIDYLGSEDEAVIRVIRSGTDPVTFTVIIPSTQNWSPSGQVPNDIMGNLAIMPGTSHLQQLADQALETEIRRYLSEPGATGTLSSVPVMFAGFSQGGIVAGALAEGNNGKYNVQQVVTVGAPVGGYTSIPDTTKVIAFESPVDPVPGLDGHYNPTTPNWQTISADNGGGLGSHNVVLYSTIAEQQDQQSVDQSNLDQFLRGDGEIADYYATK